MLKSHASDYKQHKNVPYEIFFYISMKYFSMKLNGNQTTF